MAFVLTATVYLAFVGLGFPVALLGSAWPSMHTDFLLPIAFSGYLNIMLSGGNICASIFVERIVKKIGTGKLVAISTGMISLAMFGFSHAHLPWQLFLCAAIYGLGAGGIDVSINNYLAVNMSYRHLSWSHGIWGISAFSSPFIMSWALQHKNWRFGYQIVGVIMLVMFLYFVLTLRVWKAGSGERDVTKQPVLGIRSALKLDGIVNRLIAVSAYAAISTLCQLWPSSYMVYAKQFTQERAAAFASLFFIGMTIGRFGFGLISDKLTHRRVIYIGSGIILAGILMISVPYQFQFAIVAGFLSIGIGCSQIFPSFVRSSKDVYGVEKSQAVVGVQFGMASLSSLILPSILGPIVDRFGIHLFPVILLVLLFTMLWFSNGKQLKSVLPLQ